MLVCVFVCVHVCILLIIVIHCVTLMLPIWVLFHTLSLARSVFLEVVLHLFHVVVGVGSYRTLLSPDTGMKIKTQLAIGND